MCGITGFLDLARRRDAASLRRIGLGMAECIAHRGPDDSDVWVDEEAGVCVAHRRLSILDLSPAGRQPMTSHDGRYVIVFNGEIYNHGQLKRDLESQFAGVAWRGRSDTEVLLESIARLGIEASLKSSIGMFAFALWDRQQRTLSLARDRFGEKPLYYGLSGSSLLFGSELKALAHHPDWSPSLNRDVVPMYLRYGMIPSPHTIYRSIHKLPPASVVTFDQAGQASEGVKAYWRLPLPEPEGEPDLEALEGVLLDAVKARMEADVPLGCFLSGGVDSSLVAALAQAQSAKPIRSFAIGFEDERFNEAEHARAVADHLGTDHTELTVDAAAALEVIPDLASIYDEPFADSSQIPTLLLSRLTRRHLTVALSGDGGDELFGGYSRYEGLAGVSAMYALTPRTIRNGAASLMERMPSRLVDGLARRFPVSRHRWSRAAQVLRYRSAHQLYRDRMSFNRDPGSLGCSAGEPQGILDDVVLQKRISGLAPWAAYVDALQYMPDDILVKVDRASMAASLEVRTPFLDPIVAASAARISWATKRKDGRGKWPLRQILYKHVPATLIDRPKMGFGIPLADWLRGPLRDWGSALLDEDVGLIPGVIDGPRARRLWDDHQCGRANNEAALWSILMLQAWAEKNGIRS